MATAPVCPVSRGTTPPSQSGILLPTVPIAKDLDSILQAINAIRMILQHLLGGPGGGPGGSNNSLHSNSFGPGGGGAPKNPTSNPPGGPKTPKTNPNPQPKPTKSNWTETSRATESVKVVNPNDDTQYIIFQRINSITFKDNTTGSTFVWTR